jgi:hypothetical protein
MTCHMKAQAKFTMILPLSVYHLKPPPTRVPSLYQEIRLQVRSRRERPGYILPKFEHHSFIEKLAFRLAQSLSRGSTSHSANASTTVNSSSQTTTISTSGATTTGDAVYSDHMMKSRMWAIVGGVLGGLAALALPIGLVLYIRRGQHRAASSIEQEKELSPFMMPHPPNFISDSEAQGAVGGRRTITAAAMSKSGSHSGSRTTQRGGGISDALPKRSINDTDT